MADRSSLLQTKTSTDYLHHAGHLRLSFSSQKIGSAVFHNEGRQQAAAGSIFRYTVKKRLACFPSRQDVINKTIPDRE